jgi:predicted acylesterase/phospholipase RssA
VDLDSRELLTRGDGGLDVPLGDALAATTALPVYYPPAEVAGRRLVDGGLRAVLPLDVAAAFESDLVVAVDVGPGFDEPEPKQRVRAPGLLLAHDGGEGILMAQQALDTVARWRATAGRPRLVHVRPRLPRRATFAVKLFVEFEQAGYDATRAALAEGNSGD